MLDFLWRLAGLRSVRFSGPQRAIEESFEHLSSALNFKVKVHDPGGRVSRVAWRGARLSVAVGRRVAAPSRLDSLVGLQMKPERRRAKWNTTRPEANGWTVRSLGKT